MKCQILPANRRISLKISRKRLHAIFWLCSSKFVPTGWKPNQHFVGFFVVFISYSGVGWGNNVHASLLQVLLHFHIYVMLRCGKFSCTFIHTYMLRCGKFTCTFIYTSCYAAASSLALWYIYIYIRHATLLQVLLHFHTYLHATQTKGIKHLWRTKNEGQRVKKKRVKKKWREKSGRHCGFDRN